MWRASSDNATWAFEMSELRQCRCKLEWRDVLDKCRGSNFFQSWEYGETHSVGPLRAVRRFVLQSEKGSTVMAQVRLKRVPIVNLGVAEIDWGPLWFSAGESVPRDLIHQFCSELKSLLSDRHGFEVRMRPRSAFDAQIDAQGISAIVDSGFVRNDDAWAYRTVVLDLRKSDSDLLAGFHPDWRRKLRQAEKASIELESSTDLSLFDRFYELYLGLWSKKRYRTGIRVPLVRRANEELPHERRCLLTIARLGAQDIAASLCLMFGDTVHYYLGGSAIEFRRSVNPGYLLHWHNIQEARRRGFIRYDLGGLVGQGDTGINRFKTRTGGPIVYFPGQFEARSSNKKARAYAIAEVGFRHTRVVIKNARGRVRALRAGAEEAVGNEVTSQPS